MIIEKYDCNKKYTFGCVVATYNREEFLNKTFQSIKDSFLPKDLLFVIVDDGSEELPKITINHDYILVIKNKNYGLPSHSLAIGWDIIYSLDIPYMLNLDSDIILSKNWLSFLLNVHESLDSKAIVTGFNGKNHKILESNSKFHKKESIGGINLFFKRDLYPTVRRSLTEFENIPSCKEDIIKCIDKYGKNPSLHRIYKGWDWSLMIICEKENIQRICTNPSVIQHIGQYGFTSSGYCETCPDFKDECVPKIIHQTWKNHDLPGHLRIMKESVMNNHKDYDYRFWTDDDIDQFIKNSYPQLWDFYNSYMYVIQKIDFARLLMLYHFGGVYIDIDSYCYKNVDDILKYPISLINTPKSSNYTDYYNFILNNAFISAEKHNDFIKNVIKNMINYKRPDRYQDYVIGHAEFTEVLKSTGPLMITDSYINYNYKNMITLLDHRFYHGTRNLEFHFSNVVKKFEHAGYNFIHVHESSWCKTLPPKNPKRLIAFTNDKEIII
jgi:mannosyltransferase OCH1-like enzyme